MANSARLVRLVACLLLAAAPAPSLQSLAADSSRSSSPAAAGPAGSVASLPLSWLDPALPRAQLVRQKDDYEYDYEEEDDDYDYGTKKKKPTGVQASAASETNLFNFVRIMVMRLVWGFASMFGFEEPLSEAFNGAFVPPGVDDYGDDGLGLDGDYRDYYK